nr:hypothetical protein [Natrinema salinisoli]
MQQTLIGCAFYDALPGTETGEAHTWGQDVIERDIRSWRQP